MPASRTRFVLVLAVVSAVALATVGCAPITIPGENCTSSSDCDLGEICFGGVCREDPDYVPGDVVDTVAGDQGVDAAPDVAVDVVADPGVDVPDTADAGEPDVAPEVVADVVAEVVADVAAEVVADVAPDIAMDAPDAGLPAKSVYDLKKGLVAEGASVVLTGMVVTHTTDTQVFLQKYPGSADFEGAEYSGISLFQPDVFPTLGSRVSVTGTFGSFFGHLQVMDPSVTVVSGGTELAATVIQAADAVTTIEGDGAAWEGVLVNIIGVTVSNIAPLNPPEVVENEFEIQDGLTVDDRLYLISPFPAQGTTYGALRGIIGFSWERNKLLPRGEGDVFP